MNKKLAITALTVILSAALFLMTPDVAQPAHKITKQELTCIQRATIIERGQDWVNKHVPYNQGATHDGYRTDCSGFVSMCWELAKPGLTTDTMHIVASNITKAELERGDALNCDSRHIVLFAGWANSGKTEYIGMEQANSSTGTIKRTIPYPYFESDHCFHPIKYENVC